MMQLIASSENVEEAFRWLCLARKDYGASDSVWSLRANWQSAKKEIRNSLLKGSYQFSPCEKRLGQDGASVIIWHAQDALVQRAIAQVLDKLKLTIAEDKTYIGKTKKGFSFLGYFLQPAQKLQVSRKTLKRCAARISQLYEQGAPKKRIGDYVKHFLAWAKGGMGKLVNDINVHSQLCLLLNDSPFCAPGIKPKTQKNGEEQCEEYYLGYVPLFC